MGKKSLDKARLLVRVVFGGVVAVVIVNLFIIQIVQHEHYVEAAKASHINEITIPATRGQIYMMDGDEPALVVANTKVWAVVLDPAMIGKPDAVRELLVKELGSEMGPVVDKAMENRESRYALVAKEVTRVQAERIAEAELPGVWLKEQPRRAYVEGGMAAQVLGFVTYPDEASFEFGGAGQYGVEGAFDERLQGHPGYINAVTDVNMVPLSIGDENVTVPAKNGEDIVLSLDRNIQRAAERVVQAQAEATGADWANAVVVDARDGRVLAMANYPTYEPENFAKVTDASVYLNKVVTEPFEPGSVIKTFAFAMALEEGKITPELRFNNGNGIYTTVEGGYKIGNFEKKWGGEISMRDVFVHSLNTGMVQVLRQMGGAGDRITYEAKRTLYQYYSERYHLGQKTGIGVYEEPGLVMDPDGSDQSELRFANMTFGQGMTANMLQIAVGAAAVVNGGVYHAPYIEMGGAKEGERILSEKTSAEMRSVMVDAWRYLNKKNLREYVSIGGKTGTAEVPLATGGYKEGETIGDFVGYVGATTDKPEYVVMVRIGGENKEMGGWNHAGPMFNAIVDFMVKYERIGV